MLKKAITYEDFNGDEVTEDFFFHLSKAELVELEMSQQGGLSEALKQIIASEDGKQIIIEFKKIILGSYGKRSEDGKRFIKNQTLRDEFESSAAYSALFMELVTNTDSAIEFINGIIPQGMAEEAAKIGQNEHQLQLAEVPEPKIISREEFDQMSQDEIKELGPKLTSGEVVLGDHR